MTKKLGENVGNQGGIYQETGSRGGDKGNFATVPDQHRLPPTSKPNHTWKPLRVTPPSKRK